MSAKCGSQAVEMLPEIHGHRDLNCYEVHFAKVLHKLCVDILFALKSRLPLVVGCPNRRIAPWD